MNEEKYIIKTEDLSFTYFDGNLDELKTTEIPALRSINLSVKEGEYISVLGHNGSGKSTLAKLLNLILIPTSGKIYIDGKDVSDEKLSDDEVFEVRKKVGMVFQNPDNQMVASIIEDDLAFGPENLGVPREEIETRITWALETVNMSEHRHRSPNKLSGGQKQRIAIASVLSMLPEVLVLDESTAMLDPKGRAEVMETALRLNKEKGMTVILITHYMDEAIKADKVIVLNEGEVVLTGSPSEVFSQKEIIKKASLELPVATSISLSLREMGYNVDFSLTDKQLAESICKLK